MVNKIWNYAMVLIILLTLLLFYVFAFELDFKLNNNKEVLNVVIVESMGSGINERGNKLLGQQELDELLDKEKPKQSIKSMVISNGENPNCIVKIENKTYREPLNADIRFVDLEYSQGKIVGPNIDKRCQNNTGKDFLIAGKGFTGTKSNEIVISEQLKEKLKLTDDCIGQQISIELNIPKLQFSTSRGILGRVSVLDDDNIMSNPTKNSTWNGQENYENIEFGGGKVKLMSNVEIVGIYNAYYRQLVDDKTEFIMPMTALIDGEKTYLPNMYVDKIYTEQGEQVDARIVTYSSSDIIALSNTATSEGMVFPFFVEGGYVSNTLKNVRYQDIIEPVYNYELQFYNYNQVSRVEKILDEYDENIVYNSYALAGVQDRMFIERYDDNQPIVYVIFSVLAVVMAILFVVDIIRNKYCSIFDMKIKDKRSIWTRVVIVILSSLGAVLYASYSFNNFSFKGLNIWLYIPALVLSTIVVGLIGIVTAKINSKIKVEK